jgi:hypothetical protein
MPSKEYSVVVHNNRLSSTITWSISTSSIMRAISLENAVVLQILNFIHPHLYRLVSRELILQSGNQPGNVLPVSILISLGSIETLESYKNVLLGYKFNYQSFASVVVSLGNFETIQWFSSNGWNNIRFDESLLPIIARRV